MRTRKAEMEITYNGAAVTTKLAGYETEISYTDRKRRGRRPGHYHARQGSPMDHGMGPSDG